MRMAGSLIRAGWAVLMSLLLATSSCAGESQRAAPPDTGAAGATSPRLAAGCDRFASPRGHDHWRGSRRHPFRTVKRLARSLRSGRTGCLAPGGYRHRGVAKLRRPGVTLRSLRRRRARVDGTIWITGRARGARLSRIRLTTHDRTFTIPLKVQADGVRVTGNSITTSTSANCILVGSRRRTASGVVIERNRIQRCGRTGKYDHLIYVSHAIGTVVRGNLLLDNRGGWAVHLYPDADSSLIEHNVIDHNLGGVVFAGNGPEGISDRNEVRNNAITASGPRWNIEASWSGGPDGVANVAHSNCLYSARQANGGIAPDTGFSVRANTIVTRPPYVGGGDYGFRANSACEALVGRVPGILLR